MQVYSWIVWLYNGRDCNLCNYNMVSFSQLNFCLFFTLTSILYLKWNKFIRLDRLEIVFKKLLNKWQA